MDVPDCLSPYVLRLYMDEEREEEVNKGPRNLIHEEIEPRIYCYSSQPPWKYRGRFFASPQVGVFLLRLSPRSASFDYPFSARTDPSAQSVSFRRSRRRSEWLATVYGIITIKC